MFRNKWYVLSTILGAIFIIYVGGTIFLSYPPMGEDYNTSDFSISLRSTLTPLEKLEVTIEAQQVQIATLEFGIAVSTEAARQLESFAIQEATPEATSTLVSEAKVSTPSGPPSWLVIAFDAAVITPAVVSLAGTIATFYLGLRQQRFAEAKAKEEEE